MMTGRSAAAAAMVLAVLIGAACLAGYSVWAGPLDPPTGPVAPTYKTLTEVEPRTAINATTTPGDADSVFRITQRGSYYLTGNITGVLGKHGIEIAADDVSIDLCGFSILGAPGSFAGVFVGEFHSGLQIRGGTVSNWGFSGISTSSVQNMLVESLIAESNGDYGIECELNAVVRFCIASGNGRAGIRVGWASVVQECVAASNRLNGIDAYEGCTVRGCSVKSNTGVGIDAGGACSLTACAAEGNTGAGIEAGYGSTLESCIAFTNGGAGLLVHDAVTVTRSTSHLNTGAGIAAGNECTIDSCSVNDNRLDGIVVPLRCAVRNNHCYGNGRDTGDGAGIHATAGGNRIEGNNCALADRGIDIDAALNFIARNVCEGNGVNWTVVAGNFCLVIQGGPSGAINGNAGGVSPGSTDPNANFSY